LNLKHDKIRKYVKTSELLNVIKVVSKYKTEKIQKLVDISNEKKTEEELVISCETTPSESREKFVPLGWT